MKKVFTKFLAVFLSAVLMLSVLVIGASATEEEYTGKCGTNLTWTLHEGLLLISGTGDMTSFLLTSAPWSEYAEEIESIVIDEGVTSIGNFAFKDCVNLEKVKIGKGVEMVSGSAFSGCVSVKEIKLPDSVTLIGNNAFKGCTELEFVHIPSSVTTIGSNILEGTNAYICSESIECYAKTYAEENGLVFQTCKVTFNAIIEYVGYVLKQLLMFIASLFLGA